MNWTKYSVVLCFIFTVSAFSQKRGTSSYFLKSAFFNLNGSYIFDKQSVNHRYNEYTLNLQVAGQIFKPLFIGVETYSIFTNGTHTVSNNYSIKGGFLRYEFLQKKDILFGSVSLLNGNYCTCGNSDPYKKSDIYYLGLEVGGNWYAFSNSFFVNITLTFNKILNDIPLKYNYNIYKLGIGYLIGKR